MGLPASVEVEKRLLSAMMLKHGEVIPAVTAIVGAEDFYRPEHRVIFRAISAIYDKGTPPDIVLVENELRRSGELDKIKPAYLFSLLDAEFTTARAVAQANIVKEKSTLRRLIEAGEEISDMAHDELKDINDVLAFAENKIFSLTIATNKTGFTPLTDVLQESYDRINYIRNHPNELNGVSTGLADLNRVTNGLHKSDLILLAARPSMGKTALALNIAVNAAQAGNVVALFSLEMSKSQLGNRMLSTASGVNSQQLNTGNISGDDIGKLIDALDTLGNLQLMIDDTAGLTLFDLRAKVRRLRQEHGLDLIVIDYLQLMQGGKRKYSEQNRQQEISEISRSLKALAREMDVPILALSQLSRNVEMRAEKKPQLSDLRESGSLEQDADIVMFLYRDEYYNRDDADNANVAELIIAKNRNGPTTSIRLQFEKDIMRFSDLTRADRY